MANKPTKPNFPLGLESQDQSVFQEGILNNGVVEHGPDAVMTVPETPDASGVPSAVRYNEDDDQFEGYYNEGGWLPLGGGNGGRWELLPYASSSLLQAGRAYLVDNTDGVSTVLFPSPKRVGDSVTVCDLYGKFSTYPLTVDGNGKSIYGSADSMTISTDNVSATFTWTGEARGWVITSGVGLGQGRVYSREIYSQILSASTPSIILSTQPSIVDVYVDGKRLKESLYTLDGYEVKFDPALASGSDVQIIQYIPIQLGAGGGGSGGTVITWEYNGGSAIGGETQIVLDVVVDSVSEIYIRGSRQQIGRGFTFDPSTSTITLADELEAGDDVVVVINGDPTVYNQIDRTPWEVARADNVSNSEVILSTDKSTALDGKVVVYDVSTQDSWRIPHDLPSGVKISSVSNGILVYSPGNVSVKLSPNDKWGEQDYISGPLKIQKRSQLVTYDGVPYQLKSGVSLPFITTGNDAASWLNDSVNFRCVGDEVIREQLTTIGVGKAADFIPLKQGGTVQSEIRTVSVKSFGAKGDGVTDDTAAIQAAADATKEDGCDLVFEPGASYVINSNQIKLPYVDGYLTGKRMRIFGNGCTFITNGAYEPFVQYTGLNVSTTSIIKYGYLFYDFTVTGFANRDSVWTQVVSAMALSYAYGSAYNIKGENLGKVLRMYGRALAYGTTGGSQIRDSVVSCYSDPKDGLTGYNTILKTSVDWCSGDAIISKGSNVYIDGLTYNYVGCIQETNADEISKKAEGKPGEPRGVAISAGADGVPASNIVILNVVGNYVGAGGLSINASNVSIGGVISLGSHWTDNFNADLSGGMLWLNVTNGQIGDIKAKDIYSGIGLNAGCSDIQMGKFSARSKMAVTGAGLISATDSSDRAIERVDIGGIYLHGASTINNDVYLNTAGITIGEIYIAQMNNQQGGVSVEFARACRVRKLHLIATTSSAANTNIRFSSNAEVDDLIVERTFGTAVLVQSDVTPKIGRLTLLNKQGTASPIIIQGTGTAVLNWGNVVITGPTNGRPALNGNLTMEGYSGTAWKINTAGINSKVTYPAKTTTTLE